FVCISFFFFFFQAEAGIRDRNVTGVQTCALPILFWSATTYARPRLVTEWSRGTGGVCGISSTTSEAGELAGTTRAAGATPRSRRSEERRVGKEWRAGGAGEQYKGHERRT